MKKLIFILILLSTFGVFAGGERLAILEFVDQSGKLSKQTLKNAETTLRTNLARKSKGQFQIIKSDEQKDAIVKMRKESHGLDRDESYRIALGKALSAAKIIYTTILLIDAKTYKVNCELINIETEQLENGADEFFDGSGKSLDEAIIKIVKKLLVEDEEEIPARPKKSEDQIECEYAKTENTAESWETYLEFYPRGVCAQEAKEKLDEIACQQALRANTIEALQEYLDNFNGKCKVEASKNIKKLKKAASKSNSSSYLNPKDQGSETLPAQSGAMTEESASEVDGMLWSPISGKRLTFKEADVYCSSLKSGGYSDWHLPTVDDLKTLVQHCPNLEPDGACRLSEDGGCLLARKCLNKNKCKCSSSGKHSKLNDAVAIWSASLNSSDSQEAYFFDFGSGKIEVQYIGAKAFVRCTR